MMDFLLKQRLVGAIVLVALGVIFIPMLLEGPDTLVPEMEALPEFTDPRSGEALESFPPADAVPDEPDSAVVMAEGQEQAQDQPESVPEPVPDQAQPPQQTAPPAVPEPQAAPQPAAAPEPAAAPGDEPRSEPGPLGSWIVQAGSFSSQQNAMALRDRLRKAGFATQVEKVRVDGKTHYRVRVGPYLERAEADASQRELSGKFSVNARVLSYP